MSTQQIRRIRITGKPDEITGYMLHVQDAESGETITNIKAITVQLSVHHPNWADVTYDEADPETGNMLYDAEIGGGKEMTVQTKDPELDLTAFETLPDVERIAALFHENYERLAPRFGYETREESAVPWKAVPEKNKRLMRATITEVLKIIRLSGKSEFA